MDSVLGRRPIRTAALAIVTAYTLLGSGCQSTGPSRMPASATATSAPGGVTHVLEPLRSELHFLVYRAGTFARFGHNHVIAARNLDGSMTLMPGIVGSTFNLLLPVDELDVDPTRWRDEYGDDFSSAPSAADIDGTRANMLGPDLLDSAAYPYIRVAGRIVRIADSYGADLEIAIKDTVLQRTTPVGLTIAGDTISATGSLTVDHAELGLTPFSVMLGALRVAETIEIRFELVAVRVGAQSGDRQRD